MCESIGRCPIRKIERKTERKEPKYDIESYGTNKQGWIHGNPVADGWAGAVMRKPLGIQKCDLPTDRRTDLPTDTARFRVACPRLKIPTG